MINKTKMDKKYFILIAVCFSLLMVNLVSASDTGFKSPTATSGSWINPTNAYSYDSTYASTEGRFSEQIYYNFGFSIPSGATIDGIEVVGNMGSPYTFWFLRAKLSRDGGSSWTSQKSSGKKDGDDIDEFFGASDDTWGMTWNSSDFSNTNFRIIIDNRDGDDYFGASYYDNLDHIKIKVYYTESSSESYSVDITDPTTSSPVSVSSFDNISVNFNFEGNESGNITSGVTLNNITIGGVEAPILSSVSVSSYQIVYEDFEAGGFYQDSSGVCSATDPCDWYLIGNFNNCNDLNNDYLWCASSDTSDPDGAYAGTYGLVTGDWDAGGVGQKNGLWYNFDALTSCSGGACDYIAVNSAYGSEGLDSGEYCWITEQVNDGVPSSLVEISGTTEWTVGEFNLSAGALSSSNVNVRIMCDMNSNSDYGKYDNWNITGYTSSISQEVAYIDGRGWEVNVTVPNFESGLKDLFVNATYNGNEATETQSNAINYGGEEDTIYPQFSNYWDNNASLFGSGEGLFNVTIENTNGTVLLEIDGNNITATNLITNIYNVTYDFITNGTYSYKWHSWGNGTNENYNVSNIRSYTVNPFLDETPPYFITIPSDDSITYGTNWEGVSFEATDETEFGIFAVNDSRFTINSTGFLDWTGQLPVGNYYVNISINDTTGNENSTIYNLNVTQDSSSCNVLFNTTSPINYPETFLVWTNCTSDFTLYRNGTIISNNSEQNLSAGTYNFSVQRTDTQNYSNIYDEELFTINPYMELTLPTYSGANVNTAVAGQSATFELTVNDNSALQANGYYIFSTNNSGSWVNDSAINFTSTPETIQTVKTLTASVGETIGYRWYFWDNNSNMNQTEIYTLTTTETYEISTCQDLDIENQEYTLTADITAHSGTCFEVFADNVTLNCAGHLVDGTDGVTEYGVDARNGNVRLTVENCAFIDWDIGLWIEENYTTLTNINSTSNRGNGIRIQDTSFYELTNIKTNSNGQIDTSGGLYIDNIDDSTFTNIESGSNSNAGIDMTHASTGNTFLNLNIYSNVNYGIVNELGSKDNTFTNVYSANNRAGIIVNIGGDNVNITNFTGYSNDEVGIFVVASDRLTIQDITVNANTNAGVYMENSTGSVVDNVHTYSNTYEGVWLINATNCNFTNINSHDNGNNGFVMAGSDGNYLNNVSIVDNYDGLWVQRYAPTGWDSDNNYFINIFSSGNDHGYYVGYGAGNTLTNSTIQNSDTYGIQFDNIGTGNLVYNNILNNTDNAGITNGDGVNYWNVTMQLGDRIISNGTYIGGNYWTNSSSTGYSDTCTDSNNDGFCDSALNVSSGTEGCTGNNCDYLPLSNEYMLCSLGIVLSETLSNSVYWDVATIPSTNLSAEGNNGAGATDYYVTITATGCTGDLQIKANSPLTSGGSTIPIVNQKYSFDTSDNIVPSTTKTSLTDSYENVATGLSSSTVYMKFYLNVSAGQRAGTYNNTLSLNLIET